MIRFSQFLAENDENAPDLSGEGQLRSFKHGKSTLWYHTGTENHPEIHIGSLRTPAAHRNQGHASKALQAFLHHTDKAGRKTRLMASPLDKKTKLGKLVGFYQKHGYKLTGSTGNAVGHPYMEREPQK
jgi:ribosomal protein S18 acetylase RimI-like enzyme